MHLSTPTRWLVVLGVVALVGSAQAAPPTADAMALRMLDSEALYTLTGGLKPVSEGFWQTRFPGDQDTSPEVEAARAALGALPLGPDLEAGVYVFAETFKGKRMASAFVAHRPGLRELIRRRGDVFEPLGVTPATSLQEVMEAIDRAPRAARWRGFGLVFGYPEYAVEFFVAAGDKQAETGKLVERDFVNLPTFASERGRFVYAVPKGHTERLEDRELKARTAAIFQTYGAWRSAFVGDGKPGAVALLRCWLAPPVACRTTEPAPLTVRTFVTGTTFQGCWSPCHPPGPRVRPRCRFR